MKIGLIGYGKMGKLLDLLSKNHDCEVVAKVTCQKDLNKLSIADVIIDFSLPSAVLENVRMACILQKPILIGTTGWDEQKNTIQNLVITHNIGALYSPNFSLGVHLFSKILEFSAGLLNAFPEYDVAGIEAHHRNKKDTPSGTSKYLSSILAKKMALPHEMTFDSLRCGHITGTHSVLFDSAEDSITLTHQAKNRDGFAKGALTCAKWLYGKQGWYTLDHFMEEQWQKFSQV